MTYHEQMNGLEIVFALQHSGNGIPQNGFNTWQWSDNLAYMVLNIEKTTTKTKN